jgi:hypothetical protein
MRRYLVFGYLSHDALGGWEDLVSDWDTITMAKTAAEKWLRGRQSRWSGFRHNVHIADTRSRVIVWEGFVRGETEETEGEIKWSRPPGWTKEAAKDAKPMDG